MWVMIKEGIQASVGPIRADAEVAVTPGCERCSYHTAVPRLRRSSLEDHVTCVMGKKDGCPQVCSLPEG